MSDVREQGTGNRGSYRPPRRARGNWGRGSLPPSMVRSAHDFLFTVSCSLSPDPDVRILREDVSQIAGAGESFPCRGVSTGAAPLKVLILTFKRPCEETKGSTEDSPPKRVAVPPILAGGRSGGKGAAPPATAQGRRLWRQARPRVGEADTYPAIRLPSRVQVSEKISGARRRGRRQNPAPQHFRARLGGR
jgi:hypothetical protein